jgi:DNA-binding MarR family transcriptional regulator
MAKQQGKPMNLNDNEIKVLARLSAANEDFGCYGFAALIRQTRLNRKVVRRACRSLARKGLAEFHRGLFTEDGLVAGSGYAATYQGRKFYDDIKPRDRAQERLLKRLAADPQAYAD